MKIASEYSDGRLTVFLAGELRPSQRKNGS